MLMICLNLRWLEGFIIDMWIYFQSSGKCYHNNNLVGLGYSGHGNGKNKPELQNQVNVGPCPLGLFTIDEAYDDPKHGPISMKLIPDSNNEMFGRSGFMIHPDSIEHPGEASEGCVCLNKIIRIMIKHSLDRKLVIVP